MTQPSRSVLVGLAFVAGIGLTLMVIAAGIGVIGGPAAESPTLSLLFIIGTAMLATGIIVWFAVVRPDTHFDDINVPMYHGHHESHDDHATDQKALAEHH
jgi:hypothetical protein